MAHTEETWQSGADEYNFRASGFRPPDGQESARLDEIASSVGTDGPRSDEQGPG